MSSFIGLYSGLSGIQASQTGLDITSHNVANASTPGYTRQRVELAARPTYQSASGRIGTGVDVASIARLRDNFLDDRFRTAVGDQAAASIRAEFHASLEFLSGEPDLGLATRIGKLWGAAEEWANDPEDAATRRQVLTEMASITDGFQATALAWDQLRDDTASRRDVVVTEVNDALDSLEELNRRLANADPARVGSDLLDQRDVMVDRLAELTGATSRLGTDGTVTITLGATDLLAHPAGRATLDVDTGTDPARVLLTLADGSGPVDVTPGVSGELGGLNRVVESDLTGWRTQLDDLAGALADAINAINAGGVTADGTAGGDLLAYTVGSAASSLELVSGDIEVLAAATAGTPANPPAPFDGTNARQLADLRTTRTGPGGAPDPAGETIESQLADLVTGLAGVVRSSRSAADAAAGVATGAMLARAAEHGVSLDEEMVGLVRYQRALEAAARVMTTVDQALDTLVNRVGIVGR